MADSIHIDPDSLERHSAMIDSGSDSFDSAYASFLSNMSSYDPWGEDEVSLELAAQHDELLFSAEECYDSVSETLHEAASQLKQMAYDWSESDDEGAMSLDDIDNSLGEVMF